MLRKKTILVLAGLVVGALLIALWPARSEIEPVTAPASGAGPLDGLSFTGAFGPADGSSDREDVLHFGDGRFWSKNCVPCGFSPGPYRVRRIDGADHFEGVLDSPDRGRFRYAGRVRGGRIVAHVNWRKERWYWTIDKDFRFVGTRVEGPPGGSAEDVALLALAADPGPEECRL